MGRTAFVSILFVLVFMHEDDLLTSLSENAREQILFCNEEMMLSKIARSGARAFRTNTRFLISSSTMFGARSPNKYKSLGARARRLTKLMTHLL